MPDGDWQEPTPDEISLKEVEAAILAAEEIGFPVFVRIRKDPVDPAKGKLPGVVCKDPATVKKFLDYWDFQHGVDTVYVSPFQIEDLG